MAHLSMCRICSSANRRLCSIIDTPLQIIFESVSLVPLVQKDRPVQVCSVCSSQLENCYQLRRRCVRSEELFIQLLSSQEQLKVKSDPDVGTALQETCQLHEIVELKQEELEEDTAYCTDKHLKQVSLTRTQSVPNVGASLQENSKPWCVKVEQDGIDEYLAECSPDIGGGGIGSSDPLEDIDSDVKCSLLSDGPGDDFNPVLVKVELASVTFCDVPSPARENETQVITVQPSPCTNNTLEVKSTYQNTASASTSKTNIITDVSPKKLSSIRKINTKQVLSKQFSCDNCQKCFSSKNNLIIHTRTHSGDKPYKCSDCKKGFSDKRHLLTHVRTHTGEKPYKCTDCMKCFTDNTNLIKHIRTHTGQKPYKCGDCMKCFSQKNNLLRHIRSHSSEKPYKCSYCMKCYTDKANLLNHIRSHTGEKPYECRYCMKCFGLKSKLTRHIRSHSSEKRYKCSDCIKCFSDKANLMNHFRTHTGEKPYGCKDCFKCFDQKSKLKRHIRTHTREWRETLFE